GKSALVHGLGAGGAAGSWSTRRAAGGESAVVPDFARRDLWRSAAGTDGTARLRPVADGADRAWGARQPSGDPGGSAVRGGELRGESAVDRGDRALARSDRGGRRASREDRPGDERRRCDVSRF